MSKKTPQVTTVTEAVRPATTGRTVMEGEDFSALNRLLAQVRAASAAATQPVTQAATKSAETAAKGKKS